MKIILPVFLAALCFLPELVQAGLLEVLYTSRLDPNTGTNVPELSEATSTGDKIFLLFTQIVDFLLYIAGIAAVIVIILAGVRLTFSVGTEEQIEGAKRMLLYAVLGLFAVILAFLVIQNVVDLLYYEDDLV